MKVAFLTSDTREVIRDYGNGNPSFGAAPQALLEGFALLPDKVEVHIISCLQKKPSSSPTKLAENIYYHGLHVPNIGWMKTGYQGCIRAIRRELQKMQPDIVHGQGTERECGIGAVCSGYPNILTLHGVMHNIYAVTGNRPLSYYWFAKHFEAFALRHTGGTIAISACVKAWVSRSNPRTWLVPNALRLPFFTLLPSEPRPSIPPRILNVGVISQNKRQLEVLEGLSLLREELPFSVTFIGKADSTDNYTRRFKELLRATNARHGGGFNHQDVLPVERLISLYDTSDALVHFSIEESFGLIFAEALARHLPLFASDVGAIRQLSEGASNCRIFNPNDLTGMISSLREWIKNRTYLHERSRPPNSLIELCCHPRAVASKHLEIYHSILGERPTQA